MRVAVAVRCDMEDGSRDVTRWEGDAAVVGVAAEDGHIQTSIRADSPVDAVLAMAALLKAFKGEFGADALICAAEVAMTADIEEQCGLPSMTRRIP